MIERRGFLKGILAAAFCAPAIVKAESLMHIRGVLMPLNRWRLPGGLYVGDVITFEGVRPINETGQLMDGLRQFVVTADWSDADAESPPIYPAMRPRPETDRMLFREPINSIRFATVDKLPEYGAKISKVEIPETFRMSFATWGIDGVPFDDNGQPIAPKRAADDYSGMEFPDDAGWLRTQEAKRRSAARYDASDMGYRWRAGPGIRSRSFEITS